jgi:hypothetical protein
VTAVIPLAFGLPHIRRPVAAVGDVLERKEMTRLRLAARLATIALSAAIVVGVVLPVLRVAALIVA